MFSRALCRASASMSKKAVNVPFCGYKVSADELRVSCIIPHIFPIYSHTCILLFLMYLLCRPVILSNMKARRWLLLPPELP